MAAAAPPPPTTISFDKWPVLLCEPSPGIYAIRLPYETLIKTSPDLATTASHVDVEAIRTAGFVDVQTHEQSWEKARAILVYWAALVLSQGKWQDTINKIDLRESLEAIYDVLHTSNRRLCSTKNNFTTALALPPPERQARLGNFLLGHIEIWEKVLIPLLCEISGKLEQHLLYLLQNAPKDQSWLSWLGLSGRKLDGWNLKMLPTPAVPIIPVITNLQEPYKEHPLCQDYTALGHGQAGTRDSLDSGTAGSPDLNGGDAMTLVPEHDDDPNDAAEETHLVVAKGQQVLSTKKREHLKLS